MFMSRNIVHALILTKLKKYKKAFLAQVPYGSRQQLPLVPVRCPFLLSVLNHCPVLQFSVVTMSFSGMVHKTLNHFRKKYLLIIIILGYTFFMECSPKYFSIAWLFCWSLKIWFLTFQISVQFERVLDTGSKLNLSCFPLPLIIFPFFIEKLSDLLKRLSFLHYFKVMLVSC